MVLGRDADRLAPLVVAGPCADSRARIVRNPRPDLGRSSSVRVGLEALTSPAEVLLFAAVDQPLSLPLVEALIGAAEKAWRGAATPTAILIPTFEGRRGHPILFHGTLLPELLAIGEAGLGLREVPWTSDEILLDLNTPDDAARAGAAIPPT